MPPPGTIEHLEFLYNLETAPVTTLQELRVFLLEYKVTESLLRAIMSNRTSPPSDKTENFSMDSRVMLGADPKTPILRGVVYASSSYPECQTLAIHGRPYPQSVRKYEDYTYDLSLPLNDQRELDLKGFPEAVISRGLLIQVTQKNKLQLLGQIENSDRLTYRPWTNEERYGENDASVFMLALQDAVSDLAAYTRATQNIA
jgi:hypothetical protein